MWTKRVLILFPSILCLFLFQSYLWIPNYEEQTRGNPKRLIQYINASIGDAALLNPILSSDSASAEIESLVFEGLLDRDKDLNLRPRVSKKWHIYEELYILLNPKKDASGHNLLQEIQKRQREADHGDPFFSIEEIRPLEESVEDCRRLVTKGGKSPEICEVRYPKRVYLRLSKVEPDLGEQLLGLLGENYYEDMDLGLFVLLDEGLREELLPKIIEEYLGPILENPVIIFELREGVRFHDGHPLTAEDVKFTYEAIKDPRNLSPRWPDFEPIRAVEVLDPYRLKVTYKRPYSPAISTWSMGILPKHLLDSQALLREARSKGMDSISIRQSDFNRNPVGSGPFRFVEWKSDQYIRLKRFEGYWEGSPNYEEYIFRVIPDPLTQEMEFYSGTVDSYNVLPHQVERLRKDERFQNFSGLSFGYTYIGFNLRKEIFGDIRIRKALALAVDVEKIIKYVLYGQGERITGPFPLQTPYYNRGIGPLPYDPHRAQGLIEEAGYKKGSDGFYYKDGKRLAFTLITNSGNDVRRAILAIVQDSWRKIGVDVRTDLVEWSVFVQERIGKRDFDAVILGWMMGVEPDLYQIWHSSQTETFGLNFVGYKNPVADELILKIRKEYDESKKIGYCHQLHQIIAEDHPYIFLYCTKWTALLDKRIVVMEKKADGRVEYKKIEASKTGNYMFDFNKWIKLKEIPLFLD